MHAQWEEQQKNREAESQWVHEKTYGQSPEQSGSGEEEDDMRQTILGDITHPTPIVMPQQQSGNNWLPAAILAGLAGMGVPTAALVGYSMAKDNQPQVQQVSPEFDDASSQLRLGRIEDYLDQGGK